MTLLIDVLALRKQSLHASGETPETKQRLASLEPKDKQLAKPDRLRAPPYERTAPRLT
jgi:hypothetical protein